MKRILLILMLLPVSPLLLADTLSPEVVRAAEKLSSSKNRSDRDQHLRHLLRVVRDRTEKEKRKIYELVSIRFDDDHDNFPSHSVIGAILSTTEDAFLIRDILCAHPPSKVGFLWTSEYLEDLPPELLETIVLDSTDSGQPSLEEEKGEPESKKKKDFFLRTGAFGEARELASEIVSIGNNKELGRNTRRLLRLISATTEEEKRIIYEQASKTLDDASSSKNAPLRPWEEVVIGAVLSETDEDALIVDILISHPPREVGFWSLKDFLQVVCSGVLHDAIEGAAKYRRENRMKTEKK